MKPTDVFDCLHDGRVVIRIAGSVEISGAVAHYEEDEDIGARNGVVLKMLNTAATQNRKQRSIPE